MRFRERSLARLAESDELDAPVRLTRPRGWVALVATVAVVAAGATWAVTGSLPRTFESPGVVVAARGNFTVQTPDGGQVTDVLAEPGDELSASEPVLRLQAGGSSIDVVVAEPGRVLALYAGVGDVVPAGDTVALAERAGEPGDRVVAVLFVPVSDGFRASVGAQVDLQVDSAPAQPFGMLVGQVAWIAQTAEGSREVARFLGGDPQAGGVADGVQVRRVVVELEPADTASGYAWSTGAGPPFALERGVRVVGAVHEGPIRPVDWLLP